MKQNKLALAAWIAFYIFIASLFTVNCFGYLDPDFGFHLQVGKDIIASGSVPHDQIYMWTLEGKTWVDHEWLSNVLTSGLWSLGGYLAVAAFFILLPLAGIILLNKHVITHYLKSPNEQFVFALIELAAVFACLPHFGVRLQEISFFLFIILFIIIDRFRKTKNVKSILWLIPLLYLWACLHGAFPLAVAVVLGWLCYELLIFIWSWLAKKENEAPLSKKQLLSVMAIGLIAVATTFVTPYGPELYNFLSEYASNSYYMSHIQEWRSPLKPPLRNDQIIFSIIVITFLIATWHSLKRRLPLWKLLICAVLALMSMRSVRHFPLWAIAALIFAAPLFISPLLKNRSFPYPRIISSFCIVFLLLVSIFSFSKAQITNDPFGFFCKNYPCGAVQFIKDHQEYSRLKIFNHYGWGGFIIGAWPEQRLFIDGRLPQYSFAGHSLLEEYNQFFKKDLSEKLLNQYGIQMVIFRSSADMYKPDFFERYILGRKEYQRSNTLIDYLNANPKTWKQVYSDSLSAVWVRQ